MPELPEVETIARDLRLCAVGRRIDSVRLIRPDVVRGPADPSAVKGRLIEGVRRRGKNLIISLEGGLAMVVHLKMTGQLTLCPAADDIPPHTHVVFDLAESADVKCKELTPMQLRFRDVRRFGYIILLPEAEVERLPQIARMGPEPLEMTEDDFAALLWGRRRIKALLLDQHVLAGVGNIYADEALHRAGLHPERRAEDISRPEAARLYAALREVLLEAIERRGSTVDSYMDAGGRAGSFQTHHRVYRRTGQPCSCCGRLIQRVRVSGRGSHFCPRCQPH